MNGVFVDDWEESWAADHKVRPELDHAASRVSKSRTVEKNVSQVAFLFRATRKSAQAKLVVSSPVSGQAVSPVPS